MTHGRISPVRIRMLGPFEVHTVHTGDSDDTGDDTRDDTGGSAGGAVEVPGARLRALLVALALEPGRVVQKATLVDWIWGENPPADAANALQRLASRLRRVLPDGSVDGQAGGYRLRVDPESVDAVRFERLVGQARGGEDVQQVGLLREALGLWRGPAMQDVGLQDSDAFDAAVARLDGLRLAALEDRYEAETHLGNGAELVTELTELVAEHPLRERLVAALMRALATAGRNSEALVVFQNAREALADALGVDPSPELSALNVALLRGEVGNREESRNNNLRAELTTYVGKAADIAVVRELVTEHRLTTVIGPGGSGKTRLAKETARTLLDELPDGAWLVELASVVPGTDVAQPTLSALRLRDGGFTGTQDVEPTDRVIAGLRDRAALLILDNCEHVIESAAAFAERVLGECQRLRILTTSREPLGITGEALWHLVPLDLPAENASLAEIESSPAVRLLLDRATAVRKDLTVSARTLSTVARVCRALDGMPLSIELAAARLRTMTLDQLANRLDDVFRLLTGGSRTALPRHRTLRAVIDWSWELLSEAERTVLRRLAVFSGGASLEAAERVCAGDAVDPADVLELLTALTEKSLVVADGDGSPRYRMLGMVKEYATERLAEAGETELARQAHLGYFTELAETAEPHLRSAEQLEWLAVLEMEHGNISAAMRAAIAAGDAHGAMRLAATAGYYWWLGGHKTEGNELSLAAVELPGEVPDETRALVYAILVNFGVSGRSGQFEVADWIRESYRCSERAQSKHPVLKFAAPLERLLHGPDAYLAAFESLLTDEDQWVRGVARLQMGKQRILLGDGGREADAYLETALDELRAVGERWGISFALIELADRIAVRGDFARAYSYYEQAVAVVSEVGAFDDLVGMRSRQARLCWLMGDKDASAAAVAAAQRAAERVAWPNALAELALTKAELARWGGDFAEARHELGVATAILGDQAEQTTYRTVIQDLLGYLAEDLGEARAHRVAAFEMVKDTDNALLIAGVLVGIADLALREDQDEQAARLVAASTMLRGLPDLSQSDAFRVEQTARRRLGDTRFTEATQEGTRADWRELAAVTLAC